MQHVYIISWLVNWIYGLVFRLIWRLLRSPYTHVHTHTHIFAGRLQRGPANNERKTIRSEAISFSRRGLRITHSLTTRHIYPASIASDSRTVDHLKRNRWLFVRIQFLRAFGECTAYLFARRTCARATRPFARPQTN